MSPAPSAVQATTRPRASPPLPQVVEIGMRGSVARAAPAGASLWKGKLITVVVVDGECLVANALAALLNDQPGISVVATACSLQEGLSESKSHQAEVLLVDLDATRGLDLAAVLDRMAPELRTVVLRPEIDVTRPLVGTSGLGSVSVPRSATVAALVSALRQVVRPVRRAPAQPNVLQPGSEHGLSNYERRALRFAAQGLSSTAISVELSLARGTVRNYISNAIRKTGTRNRIEAARVAYERGWL